MIPQAPAPNARSTKEIALDKLLRAMYPEHFGVLNHRLSYWRVKDSPGPGWILCNDCEYNRQVITSIPQAR